LPHRMGKLGGRGRSKRHRRRDWEFTANLLGTYLLADSFAFNPKVRPSDFYETLESLDTALSVFHRLDRARVEAIEPSRRPLFLSRYLAAAVTGMARGAGILRGLETTGLVRFREPGTCSLDEGYLEDTPELAPVLSELPYFGSHFLGMLQQELEASLAGVGLVGTTRAAVRSREEHSSRERTDPAYGGPGRRAIGSMAPERLFDATGRAIEAYFLKVSGGRDRGTVNVLAEAGCPFVFLWLCTIGLLDDMVEGLLDGKPVLRRTVGGGKGGREEYVPTGGRPMANLFPFNDIKE